MDYRRLARACEEIFALLIVALIFLKIASFVQIHSHDDTLVTLAKYDLIAKLFGTANNFFRAVFAVVICVPALLKGGLKLALVAGGLGL
jgi:hypothetical protein